MSKIKAITGRSRYYSSFLSLDLARVFLSTPGKRADTNANHIRAAVQWLCRAQDVSGDGGVARSYSLVYNPFFKRRGWTPSYPETTGYIIPTFFDYFRLTGDREIFARAVRMVEWESRVQMKSGAVMGGTVDAAPSPAIFNTGQVIFGWTRAYVETGNAAFLNSAARAGDFLIREQDPDGAWRKKLSNFATSRIDTYVYNTRTAWALLYLHSVTNEPGFRDAAVRNMEFALTQQLENGWFRNNCLYSPAEPLLHTIAYSIRGILESGILLKDQRYINAAKKAADALMLNLRSDGSLSGRFNDRWEPRTDWSCLTGNAQTGIIWGRLYQTTGETKYLEPLKRVNGFLKSVQLMGAKNPDLYGGITGSYPVNGVYGKHEILNWAVKFFIDSLMMEDSIAAGK